MEAGCGDGAGWRGWVAGSARLVAGGLVTWKILDTSSEFRCCAMSHSLAVMSIRRPNVHVAFMAFSWIFVSGLSWAAGGIAGVT